MKQTLKIFALLAAALVVFNSCNKVEPTPEPIIPETIGVYVLNNGKMGSNNTCLAAYDPITKNVTAGIFQSRNGKRLGDTAQDILVYGHKMYITVYNSAMIFVTDLYGTIIKEIPTPDKAPRCLTSYNGNVFVSYYGGEVAKLDTTSLSVVKTVKVGDNPEELKVANDKLYVANSGGMSYPNYGNTVSVINPSSMEVIKDITVADNPCYMEVNSKGEIFVISLGNYGDVPAVLQKIDTNSDTVTAINDATAPSFMSMGSNDKLYIISSTYDENWNQTFDFYTYNTTSAKKEGNYITDGTVVPNAYSISVDPISGNIYMGSSDYVSNGDMYVFTKEGKLYDTFDTGGLNPITVAFVTNL